MTRMNRILVMWIICISGLIVGVASWKWSGDLDANGAAMEERAMRP